MPSRYPLRIAGNASQPGDPATFHGCYPEWVRAFRSPDTTTPWPGPTQGYLDPMNGPTLRARVGDFIELTFKNEIDPAKFANSVDRGDQQLRRCAKAKPAGGYRAIERQAQQRGGER